MHEASKESVRVQITRHDLVSILLALTMLLGMVVVANAEGVAADKIKIGISIWSSTDTLGSECKRLIDAAAEALKYAKRKRIYLLPSSNDIIINLYDFVK